MTSCPACADFERNPRTHSFHARCLECSARSIAGSPAYFNAASSKTIPQAYRAVLQRAFGADWIIWHERVKYYAGLLGTIKERT